MTMLIKTLAACAASTVLATSAFAQTARHLLGPVVTQRFTVPGRQTMSRKRRGE